MVLSQERPGGIYQLWCPRPQSTQIKLLKQSLLSLLCSQLLCLDALDLIQCVNHSRPYLWLWHLIGSYHSCHWDLLLQSLRVYHTIPHYDGDSLAAIAHLGVSIVYCQILGQWSFVNTQGLSHHIQPHTGECSLCPACIILDEKASIILLSLVVTTPSYSVGSSTLVVILLSSTVVVTCLTAKRKATWTLTQGVTSASISFSVITFMMWPIVGSPRSWGPEPQSQTNPGL